MKKPVFALSAAALFGVMALVACSSSPAASGTDTPTPSAPTQVAASFDTTVAPVIKKNCMKCHSGDQPADNKAFPEELTEAWAKENGRLMKQSARELEEDKMPPKNETQQPTAEESKAVIDWVNANIS